VAVLGLNDSFSQRFERELLELEESLNMPYVTSVERIAEARGAVGILLRLLAKAHGPLPEDFADRIRDLPFGRMEALSENLLEFRSLADLQAWLDRNDAGNSP
jgi:hypothetical protein